MNTHFDRNDPGDMPRGKERHDIEKSNPELMDEEGMGGHMPNPEYIEQDEIGEKLIDPGIYRIGDDTRIARSRLIRSYTVKAKHVPILVGHIRIIGA